MIPTLRGGSRGEESGFLNDGFENVGTPGLSFAPVALPNYEDSPFHSMAERRQLRCLGERFFEVDSHNW